MTSEPYLLTPGPLTTSLRTRQSMLRDWGSWDVDFNTITGRVRERLLQIVHGAAHTSASPCRAAARSRSRPRSVRWLHARDTCWSRKTVRTVNASREYAGCSAAS